jgi:hypothetical protein
MGHGQDAEKIRQRRSRIVQTLNVPPRVRLGSSLAAALLDSLFEQPAGFAGAASDFLQHCIPRTLMINLSTTC